MGMPDEYTIECNDCGSYNDNTIKSLCQECINKIIDEWCDECDKLFETSDIKKLKEKFALK